MTQPHRPRRSALYLPASNSRAIDKARGLPCDVVILDLEDAVLPEAKDEARDRAAHAIGEGGFGRREVVVRVNSLETPWGAADLETIAKVGPDAILAPKIRFPADVRAYDQAIATASEKTRLWVMIETVQSIIDLAAVASTARETRLASLVMGLNDLALEMGARQTPDRGALQWAMAKTVTVARAAGLAALDGVHNDIEDLAGLEAACRQGADFGFTGKSVIHPSHLEACNRLFSPTPEALTWGRAVVEAFAAPENRGKGALRVDGRLAEVLHRDQAVRLLGLAEAIAAAEDGG